MAYLFMLSQPTLGIISPLLSLSPSPLSSSLSQPHPLPPSLSFSLPDYHLTLPSLPPPPPSSLSLSFSPLSLPHKCFTSIVGPNGSGKSNVIDAMLFVFGYRARKIRSKKISVLIHCSDHHQNLESCIVSVHFQRIIDLVYIHMYM